MSDDISFVLALGVTLLLVLLSIFIQWIRFCRVKPGYHIIYNVGYEESSTEFHRTNVVANDKHYIYTTDGKRFSFGEYYLNRISIYK